MQQRPRQSFSDLVFLWGFIAVFAALLGSGVYEAYKVVSAIPAAFDASSTQFHNPMSGSDENPYAGQRGGRMTPRERSEYRRRSGQN